MTSSGHLALLTAKGISKRFGGVHALSDVGFTINHGEIYGLIGPNGAGKTSLFNVLTGIYEADGGDFTFDGPPLNGLKPNTFYHYRLVGVNETGTSYGEDATLKTVNQ